VAPSTEFRFAVGWRGTLDDEGRRLRDLARTWLVEGLTQLGAGAKTSAGYGYFTDFTLPEPRGEPVPTATTKTVPSAAAVPPAPQSPVAALEWRLGIIREYQPDKGHGRLADAETNAELRFNREAIEEKGWSPGKKAKVQYAIQEQGGRKVVVKVKRG